MKQSKTRDRSKHSGARKGSAQKHNPAGTKLAKSCGKAAPYRAGSKARVKPRNIKRGYAKAVSGVAAQAQFDMSEAH